MKLAAASVVGLLALGMAAGLHAQSRQHPAERWYRAPRCFAHSPSDGTYACAGMAMETLMDPWLDRIGDPRRMRVGSVERFARRVEASLQLDVQWGVGGPEPERWLVLEAGLDDGGTWALERHHGYGELVREARRRGYARLRTRGRPLVQGRWLQHGAIALRFQTEEYEAGGISFGSRGEVRLRCSDGTERVPFRGNLTGATLFAAPGASTWVLGIFDGDSGGEGVWCPSSFYEPLVPRDLCSGSTDAP